MNDYLWEHTPRKYYPTGLQGCGSQSVISAPPQDHSGNEFHFLIRITIKPSKDI